MGSLRLQHTYRIDPNELRSLPPGVAWIITGGRAAKVAVARGGRAPLAGSPRRVSRGGRAPLAGSPRRDPGDRELVGPGDPALSPHRASSAGTPGLGRADAATAEVEHTHTDQRPSLDDGPDAVAAETEVSADAVEEGTPMGSSDSLAAAQPAPPGTVPVR
jgi:hypothetical protein